MACLAETAILDFLAGRLPPDEVASIDDHVDRCPSCRLLVVAVARSTGGEAPTLPADDVGSAQTLGNVGSAATLAVGSGPPSTPALDGGITRGTTLGRYVILDVLGKGGMGVVYTAFDPELDRKVALKLLRPELAGGEAAATRLLREGRSVAKLAHPNVVAVFDVGTHDGTVFVAMELVDGRSLDVWIDENRRPWRDVLQVFLQAGEGLAAAHAIGMVHRDFKPANVLLGKDGRARVTDFGLARTTADPRERSSVEKLAAGSGDARLTRTGALVGTPAYMSPEQFEAREVDARTDQFAFAVSLYEALYGERPFAGVTAGELFANVTSEIVRTAPDGSAVPAWLRAIVLRGMRVNPDERYPDLEALLAELRHDPGLRRKRIAIGGAVALLGCAAVGAVVLSRSERGPQVDCAGEANRAIDAAWRVPRLTLKPSKMATSIDKLADEWRTASIKGCQQPNPDPVLRGLERSCLVSFLDSYATLAAQLRDPTPGMLGLIGEDVDSPDTPSRCVEHMRKSYPVPLPQDPQLRATAITAREKYLRAATNGTELTSEQASALAQEAVTLSETAGHDATTANAYSVLGGALLDRNDTDGAIAAWRKSITFAERGEAFATLAFSHVLLANSLCNMPDRGGDCEAEIERARSYFDKHPDEQSEQFEMTSAGYEAARLLPEVGAERLRAYVAKHPASKTDPYMALQFGRNLSLAGRSRQALDMVDGSIDGARTQGPPALVSELADGRCGYALDLGRLGDARSSLAELEKLAAADADLTSANVSCDMAIRVATGDYAGAMKAGDKLAQLTEGRANGWHIGLMLANGRVQEARVALGPPPHVTGAIDWSVIAAELSQFDIAYVARDDAAARVVLDRVETELAKIPRTSYTWLDPLTRRASLELATGHLESARPAIVAARELLAARDEDTSLTARLTVGALEAEVCMRSAGTACAAAITAPLATVRTAGMMAIEANAAAVLAAESAQPVDAKEMCRAWKWLAPYRSVSVVQALDAARIGKRCH